MIKDNIVGRQISFLIAMFIIGSTIILSISSKSSQDSWISIIISILLAVLVSLIYARIIKLNPGESIYDINKKLFGKVIGTIMNILMMWYAFHLGAMVVCNFQKYIDITSLQNTPEIVISFFIVLACVYIGKSKISTFGKWGSIVFIIVSFIVLSTVIMSISKFDFNNILPIMEHKPSNILYDAINNYSFPFAETVLFLCIASIFKKNESPYKIYTKGLIMGGIVILIVLLRNLLVLGPVINSNMYFPSYITTRIVELGDHLTRLEGVVTINFILAGITKITVCLLAAAKGMTKIFNINNYKELVVPSALIILALCSFLYNSIFEMYDFINVYSIYAFPFQIIIPIIVWIASEIKSKKKMRNNTI